MKNSIFKQLKLFSVAMALLSFIALTAFMPAKLPEPEKKGYTLKSFVNKGFNFTPPKFIIYTTSAPLRYDGKSNIVISGKDINSNGTATSPIYLINCTNIHITACKLSNSTKQGVYMYNCKNITIDNSFITNVSAGVYCNTGSGIKTLNCQFLNMKGPLPGGNFIQYGFVNGAGSQIIGNHCEDIITGSGANPYPGGGDGISLYQSNGTPDSPIQVINNWVRGGGTNVGGLGMAGIVGGDVGGSWQYIAFNILVNTGYVGAQIQGGTNITFIYNKIYGKKQPWTGLGLGSANYSTAIASNNMIAFNMVNWVGGAPNRNGRFDTVYKTHAGSFINNRPVGWDTNITNAAIDENILPKVIITMH